MRPIRGVRIIGDLPIYVAPASADHAEHPELFREGLVAGAPPDKLNADGQFWGNPVYDWRAMRRDGYAWWIARMRRACSLFDLVRIDHFRGFVAGWEIPADATDARAGRWYRGPRHDLFDALRAALGPLPVIAEDLGRITPAVVRLREELGFPGMVVLIWAFARGASNPYAPDNHPVNAVACTGTHDTPTIAQWWEEVASRRRARRRGPTDRGSWHRRSRAVLAAGPAGALIPRPPGDRSDAGRARPRGLRAHEPTRHRRRQLDLAARCRCPRRRTRLAPRRGHPAGRSRAQGNTVAGTVTLRHPARYDYARPVERWPRG